MERNVIQFIRKRKTYFLLYSKLRINTVKDEQMFPNGNM